MNCFAGGIADDLINSKKKFISISTTDDGHAVRSSFFEEPFWKSFSEKEADLNKNGDVSLREAYLYGVKHFEESDKEHFHEGYFGKYLTNSNIKDVSLKNFDKEK